MRIINPNEIEQSESKASISIEEVEPKPAKQSDQIQVQVQDANSTTITAKDQRPTQPTFYTSLMPLRSVHIDFSDDSSSENSSSEDFNFSSSESSDS